MAKLVAVDTRKVVFLFICFNIELRSAKQQIGGLNIWFNN